MTTTDIGLPRLPKGKWKYEMSKLERATLVANSFFEGTQRAAWSSLWPHAHCWVSSLLLAPLIRIPLEWDVRVVVGAASPQSRFHAWIQSPEGDIIDPTYGQFDGGAALRILAADQSTLLGHRAITKRLTLDEEESERRKVRPLSGNDRGFADDSMVWQLFGTGA